MDELEANIGDDDEEDGETEEDDGPAVNLLELFGAAAENPTEGANTAQVANDRPREIIGISVAEELVVGR